MRISGHLLDACLAGCSLTVACSGHLQVRRCCLAGVCHLGPGCRSWAKTQQSFVERYQNEKRLQWRATRYRREKRWIHHVDQASYALCPFESLRCPVISDHVSCMLEEADRRQAGLGMDGLTRFWARLLGVGGIAAHYIELVAEGADGQLAVTGESGIQLLPRSLRAWHHEKERDGSGIRYHLTLRLATHNTVSNQQP